MSGDIFPVPQYVSMAWCSVKAQGQRYLYLYLNDVEIKIVYQLYISNRFISLGNFNGDDGDGDDDDDVDNSVS
jgi:hypothetical protein